MASEAQEIDLTPRQREILRSVFARHAGRVEAVGVYGSRAQGRARPGSDIDLVVFGPEATAALGAIRLDLEESDLSVFADVVAFDEVDHLPLKQQIERWMKWLFRRRDLQPA